MIHAADLGSTARPYHIARKWSSQICEEFFNQGDIEVSMGLPISFNCDRRLVNIPKS